MPGRPGRCPPSVSTRATDVTGFGLLGHLGEMVAASRAAAIVEHLAVPVIDGVSELARAGVVPGGTARNLAAVERVTDFGNLDAAGRLILADAQTSGGLLISVAADRAGDLVEALTIEGTLAAAVVGEITDGQPGTIAVR